MFTVVGEALIDLVQHGDATTLTAHPGGSPYNVAIGLGRLGATVSLATSVGTDAFGKLLEAKARNSGVDLDQWRVVEQPTSLAVADLGSDGSASYGFYFDGTASFVSDRSAFLQIRLGRVLHVGSIASWHGSTALDVLALQRRAMDIPDTVVSYDPNLRSTLLDSPTTARRIVEANVAATHIVKASEEDLEYAYPNLDIASVARRWCGLGASLVVITLGAKGAVAFGANGSHMRRAGKRVVVADTVGAGDSFTAALLSALTNQGLITPKALATAPAEAIGIALDHAVVASAITCERRGAEPPTSVDVELTS